MSHILCDISPVSQQRSGRTGRRRSIPPGLTLSEELSSMPKATPIHSTLDADLRLLCLEFHALRAIETAPVHAPDGIDVEAFSALGRAAVQSPARSWRSDPQPQANARRWHAL
jgi:hypothetical protein